VFTLVHLVVMALACVVLLVKLTALLKPRFATSLAQLFQHIHNIIHVLLALLHVVPTHVVSLAPHLVTH
jgi:hypothetical protein